jgi:hypothetical protein
MKVCNIQYTPHTGRVGICACCSTLPMYVCSKYYLYNFNLLILLDFKLLPFSECSFFLLGYSRHLNFVPTFRYTVPSVVLFLLGDFPASEFYVLTFRYTVSIPYVVLILSGGSLASEFYVTTFRYTVSSICCILSFGWFPGA